MGNGLKSSKYQLINVPLSYQNTPILIGTSRNFKIDIKTMQLNLGVGYTSRGSLPILPLIFLGTVRCVLGGRCTGEVQIFACSLPWVAFCLMFGSSLGALRVVLGESLPEVLTSNVSIKVLGSNTLLLNTKVHIESGKKYKDSLAHLKINFRTSWTFLDD